MYQNQISSKQAEIVEKNSEVERLIGELDNYR